MTEAPPIDQKRTTRHTAANDNPGGATETQLALQGLVTLLARAEARRLAQASPANRNANPGSSK